MKLNLVKIFHYKVLKAFLDERNLINNLMLTRTFQEVIISLLTMNKMMKNF